jgi:biopolymer transport protein ExbD
MNPIVSMNNLQALSSRLTYFLALILLASCSVENKNPPAKEIEIEVNADNQYFVNGKLVAERKLKEVLSNEKVRIIKTHLKGNEIEIILRVDEKAKVKSLGDLETILRQLNLRKIKYMKKAPQFSSDPEHTS